MVWQQWLYVAVVVISLAFVTSQVGKPRKPLTGGDLAGQVIVAALLVWLVTSI